MSEFKNDFFQGDTDLEKSTKHLRLTADICAALGIGLVAGLFIIKQCPLPNSVESEISALRNQLNECKAELDAQTSKNSSQTERIVEGVEK